MSEVVSLCGYRAAKARTTVEARTPETELRRLLTSGASRAELQLALCERRFDAFLRSRRTEASAALRAEAELQRRVLKELGLNLQSEAQRLAATVAADRRARNTRRRQERALARAGGTC